MQYHVEPAFCLAREHGNTHLPAIVQVNRAPVQHRQTSRHVKTADGNRNARLSERPRDVEGAGILVGLNADQCDKAEGVMAPKACYNCLNIDTCVGFVDRFNVDCDIGAKDLSLSAITSDTVECRERVRWNHRAPPADYISIIVVMRRFNQDELEAFYASWPRLVARHQLPFLFDGDRQRQASRFQSNGVQPTDDRLDRSRSGQG